MLVTTPSPDEPEPERPERTPPGLPVRAGADPSLDRLRRTYDEVHGRLWRAVLAWSGSAHVADEAVAEAFAQALRRGGALRDPAAWVWRAAFRIAAGDLARQRRDAAVGLDGLDVASPEAFCLPDEAVDLLRALQQLTPAQRQAVVLTDGAGFTAPEAAAVLGISAVNVRAHASRARRRLRSLLTDPTPKDDR